MGGFKFLRGLTENMQPKSKWLHSKCIQILIKCDSNFKLPAPLFKASTSVGYPGNDIVKLAKTGLIPAATNNYNCIFQCNKWQL